MTILAKNVERENLSKYHLEQALLALSVEKRPRYKRKCKVINDILNEVVRAEISSGRYSQYVPIPHEIYNQIVE